MKFGTKSKTRALKHRRTDESEPAAGEGEADSSEVESDSSSDDAPSAPQAKPKGKAKPRTSAAEKAKAKVKAAAEKCKKKLAATLEGLRGVVRHELILEVADDALAPVRTAMQDLQGMSKSLAKIEQSGEDDGAIAIADAFDHKACNASRSALAKALRKLEKKQLKRSGA